MSNFKPTETILSADRDRPRINKKIQGLNCYKKIICKNISSETIQRGYDGLLQIHYKAQIAIDNSKLKYC